MLRNRAVEIHLLLRQATASERKKLVATRFISTNLEDVRRDIALVCCGDSSVLKDFDTLAGPPPEAS